VAVGPALEEKDENEAYDIGQVYLRTLKNKKTKLGCADR
jgi:hypothetical protein